MSVSNRRTERTMCPMNCYPTLCGMLATVEDDRLVEIRGDKDNPDSQGFLCVRGRASKQIMDNPDRLLHPMARTQRGSDDWRPITWEEALDRIVASMQRGGRESVALWPSHGSIANDFGVFANLLLALRFANMYGCQWWDTSMLCWGFGGFGLGLTGAMEVNTGQDMGRHSDYIVLWGANYASQPHTARHVADARKRGAKVVAIDIRVSDACRSADEHFIVKPGTDAALALAMMQVIIDENLHDQAFIDAHTIGFEALRKHVESMTPAWAEQICGVEASRIVDFARAYATTERAMLLLGASSMYKDPHGWRASRAISCLPALTGKLSRSGAGFGPRHGAAPHGRHFSDILNFEARPDGNYIPMQMSAIADALAAGRISTLMLFGSDLVTSFADATRMQAALDQVELIVAHDLFMNQTMRNHADIVLPGTTWLEDVGVKATATHLYLMDRILPPAGQSRSMTEVIKQLATRLDVTGFYPWEHDTGHIDAVLDHPSTGGASVQSLRDSDGIGTLSISHVAHPDRDYSTPSGKIEFYSQRAAAVGLSPLPTYEPRPTAEFPLELRTGRTLNHFHAFYDSGRALPALARRESGPTVWISPADAGPRGIGDGHPIRLFNERGALGATANVTERIAPGTVWLHSGWPGLNRLTSGAPALSDDAIELFSFSTGQSGYDAHVEVAAVESGQRE